MSSFNLDSLNLKSGGAFIRDWGCFSSSAIRGGGRFVSVVSCSMVCWIIAARSFSLTRDDSMKVIMRCLTIY
ncbi:hypothetical protein FGO68_gene16596 [Halteria grandinella]|uniref:Uncharacterized protein n=1 Tax=Halteria grandinella TaxID=5974 RepID=A0A8J8T358_HALGN|nr:hypothetical protein FGO68_gene16596 [Halteria grandinella]